MNISIGSYKLRLEIAIIIIVVLWILFGSVLCSCCNMNFMEGLTAMGKLANKAKEGFTGPNNGAFSPEFSKAKSPDYITNPSTWTRANLTYSPGTKPDAAVKAIWDRPQQPIPLPKGEMYMFATTDFAPECCPNAYSSSTGCACMTVPQYNYLIERGGNNVPYSEY